MENSELEKLKRANARGEFIHRHHDEFDYSIGVPEHRLREKYPWEMTYIGKHARITKEYFRCRGSSTNPPHIDHRDPVHSANFFDCGGFQKHSLPVRGGQEFIYPILMDLLNDLQTKTGRKVVVTCGHRCPVHNVYADPSSYNQNSKHMIGAEVDFYVQGMENQPENVIQTLIAYYKESPQKDLREFQRLETAGLNVSTAPWFNKEILIKLCKKDEGRDFDNRHPYPYISVQVRFDSELNEKVIVSGQKAMNCYQRF
jgi:Peptidase M15